MALPATDDFNRTAGALGANWTGSVGSDLAIGAGGQANMCIGTASAGDNSMYWSADAPAAGQYAQAVVSLVGGWMGPFVRGSSTDWVMGDAAYGDATKNYKIEWYNSGSYTTIGSAYNTTPANGDTIYMEASSSTFTLKLNGTQRCTGSNGSAPSTGYGGIYIYGLTGMDNFEVGNLAAPSGVGIPLVMNDQRRRRVA